MKGLILKDLITLKSYLKGMLFICLLFAILGVSNSPLSGALMLLPISILMSFVTFSYDNLSHWDSYACTLPLSRRQIVLSRYLMTLLMVGAFVIIALPCYFIFATLLHNFSEIGELIPSFGVLIGTILLLVSVLLGLNYRFGPEKARMVLVIIFIIPSILSSVLTYLNMEMPGSISLELFPLALIMLCLGAAAYVGSYQLSASIYQRKEF